MQSFGLIGGLSPDVGSDEDVLKREEEERVEEEKEREEEEGEKREWMEEDPSTSMEGVAETVQAEVRDTFH